MILICGPCQIESRDHALKMAGFIKEVANAHGVEIIYKSSYDKANRTFHSSLRGVGIHNGLGILRQVKEYLSLRTITDVHEVNDVEGVAAAVDIVQIPALLCRQTDLIVEAGKHAGVVAIKKGQFLSPRDMQYAVAKVESGVETWLIERGTCFGYGDLVFDPRSIDIMRQGQQKVIFDCTHSVQHRSGYAPVTGGYHHFSETLARAAVAAGADGLFIEVHDDPINAPSDGDCMMDIKHLYDFLGRMLDLKAAVDAL